MAMRSHTAPVAPLMNGWDSDRFHEPDCDDSECRGCKPPEQALEADRGEVVT